MLRARGLIIEYLYRLPHHPKAVSDLRLRGIDDDAYCTTRTRMKGPDYPKVMQRAGGNIRREVTLDS